MTTGVRSRLDVKVIEYEKYLATKIGITMTRLKIVVKYVSLIISTML